jgi:Glycosyl transferase family 2
MTLSPIALFTYNRPWHTRQTVEALRKNKHAENSALYIFSDGAKTDTDEAKVREVRGYVKTIDGFKSISVIEREKNLGLAESVISGVTEVVNGHGKIIVLEDDLITSPYFLSYMNHALRKYEDVDKVMHISGYVLPIESTGLPNTFFYRAASCWGWGTWERAWKYFDYDINKLISRFNDESRYKFNIDGKYNFWGQMESQRDGRINSWAIRWYASVFLNNGRCLHPSKSMINNIGFDGTGIHCNESDIYNVELHDQEITEFEERCEENREALERIKNFLATTERPLHMRIIYLLKKKLAGFSKRKKN